MAGDEKRNLDAEAEAVVQSQRLEAAAVSAAYETKSQLSASLASHTHTPDLPLRT